MNSIIINFIVKYFYYVFIGFILLNVIMGRKNKESPKKRFAVLYIAIFIFILFMYSSYLKNNNLSDVYLLFYFSLVIPASIYFKKYLFPFQLRCEKCKKFLSLNIIMFTNSNKCEMCESSEKIEENKKEK